MTQEMKKDENEMAVQEFNVTDAAIAEVKEYEKIQVKDTESEKTARKCRQIVRGMRTDIEARRKELKAPVLERGKLIDQTAKTLTNRILPTEQNLDEKIKVVEAEKEQKRLEKERIEKERQDKIYGLMENLKAVCNRPLAYGRPAAEIEVDIKQIKDYEISSVDFQERTEEAKQIKQDALKRANEAFADRKKYEEEQVALQAEKKRQEAERQKIKAERKAQEEAARKKAEVEAEARRKEQEKLEAQRREIEAEKAKMEAKKKAEAERKEAEKKAKEERKKAKEQFESDHAEAVEMNAEHDKQKAENLKADAMVEPDKKKLLRVLIEIEMEVKSVEFGAFNTDNARMMSVHMVEQLNHTIQDLKQRIEGLECKK